MDYQEAIGILRRNKPTSDPRRCGKELCEACDVAISAMQELQKQNDDICGVTNLSCCRCQPGACENRRRNDGLSENAVEY